MVANTNSDPSPHQYVSFKISPLLFSNLSLSCSVWFHLIELNQIVESVLLVGYNQ